jgi:DNA adenine methylase
MVKSPLKYHGGKNRLAAMLVDLTPKCIVRAEHYGGAMWYTLASDPKDVCEVVNDKSLHLTNFWWCLQSDTQLRKMKRYLEARPFSEIEYKAAETASRRLVRRPPDPISAAHFFTHCRQSRAGSFKGFATLSKNRLRRGMNEQASAWWTAIDGLEAVHARLQRIAILNKPAIDTIRILDAPGTHHYLDPPYPPEVRVTIDAYAHEMTTEEHEELLDLIDNSGLVGTFMISGKRCELYDKKLKNWRRIDTDVPLDSAGGKSKRRTTECVWLNYDRPKPSEPE